MPHARSILALLITLGGCRGAEAEISDDPIEMEAASRDVTWLPSDLPQHPSRVVFLGDSITAGFGADDGLDYAALLVSNDDAVWPANADDDLESRFGGPVQVENVAVPGATTTAVLTLQLAALEEQLGAPPWSGETLVVMTVGGNDLQFAIPRLLEGGDAAADEVLGAMELHLDDILTWFDDRSRFPDGAHVYITNVYEPTDGIGYVPTCLGGTDIEPILPVLDAANERYRSTAIAHDVGLLDLRHAFLGHAFYSDDPDHFAYHEDDPTLWMAPDCIHPNERGHHEIRMLFMNALSGALPRP